MDGDVLRELYGLCLSINSTLNPQPSTLLYLDDAHGTGVLGRGRGALAHFGIKPEPWIIQMGTFSKALGAFGAFAAGSNAVMQWISNRARANFFNRPAACCCAASSAAEMSERTQTCSETWSTGNNSAKPCMLLVHNILSETPIIPIKTTSFDGFRISQFLFDHGYMHLLSVRQPLPYQG
jgi:7-keto-8-aminopelargonate synthetase-like enzyme